MIEASRLRPAERRLENPPDGELPFGRPQIARLFNAIHAGILPKSMIEGANPGSGWLVAQPAPWSTRSETPYCPCDWCTMTTRFDAHGEGPVDRDGGDCAGPRFSDDRPSSPAQDGRREMAFGSPGQSEDAGVPRCLPQLLLRLTRCWYDSTTLVQLRS